MQAFLLIMVDLPGGASSQIAANARRRDRQRNFVFINQCEKKHLRYRSSRR